MRCVSANVRRTRPSVSDNLRWNGRSIARLAVHHCAPLQLCLAGAPPNQNKTGLDRSLADFTWCLTALDWGHGAGEVAERLREVSEKAAQQGGRYAASTARQAARALATTHQQR